VRPIGTTQRRVIVALLVTALLPLVTAMVLATTVIQRISESAFRPEFRQQLDRSLSLYRDLARSMKRAMGNEATAIAADVELREAAARGDGEVTGRILSALIAAHPSLLSLSVDRADAGVVAARSRVAPLDPNSERGYTVKRNLGSGDRPPVLTAVFAADRQRFDEVAAAQRFAETYEQLEQSYYDATQNKSYITLFAGLLGITVVLAVIVGALVVRPITSHIDRLVAATRPVAEGDLSVRVDADGPGEIAELAQAFNHMLVQLDKSRARIEFLKRIGQWQTVARRLAHEIKNPLTPIQLAVEECCQRYRGDDQAFRSLLTTTRDIVTEEVASLRELVGEFAAFARLPRANLKKSDLGELIREQWPRLEKGELPDVEGREVVLAMDVASEPMPVALDRTMFHRVLVNLLGNATQATAEMSRDGQGHVWLHARREGDWCVVEVDDDGPGIPNVLKGAVFDPYVTTKKNGTGLGLSIVQKVVLDHGGTVDVDDSPSGGARFVVTLPIAGTMASEAAMSRSHAAAWSGTGSRPG
jgi:nitrogen fixation/metabolism regulation signal transduction histidine kinase